MPKFVIDSVLIEKSSKDIKENEKYTFSDGLNIITGNNEAGKSSLMKFIKEGLFKEKGVDTGKIFFKYEDKLFRADVKDNSSVDKRCKIFDSDNNICSNDFINKIINENYFKEGFYISLDDLMKIQSKDTASLVNVIKDPTGDSLNEQIKNIYEEINSIIGQDFKPKKDLKELIEKINQKNQEIIQLSKKEDEYYKNINDIKFLDEQISLITKKEDFLKLQNYIAQHQNELKELEIEYNKLNSGFNQKLYDGQKFFLDIFENLGKYNSNLENIEKYKQKSELLINKITTQKENLNSLYALNFTEQDIAQFVIDFEKIRKIKENNDNIIDLTSQLKLLEQKKEDTDYNIKRFDIENDINFDVEKLKELYPKLEDGLKQYYFITSQLNTADVKFSQRKPNKAIQIIFSILLVIMIGLCVFCFVQKFNIQGIFALVSGIICILGLVFSNGKKSDEDIIKKKDYIKNILDCLKSDLVVLYPELNTIEESYLPTKLENIKTHMAEFIKKYNEKQLLISQTDTVAKKISDINNKINELNRESASLTDLKDISFKNYIEAVDIINSLKNDINEKNQILSELDTAQKNNDDIIENIKKFIIESDVNIELDSDLKEIIQKLNLKSEENNKIKKDLDNIKNEIDSINQTLSECQIKIEQYKDFTEDLQINTTVEMLESEKEEKQKQKQETEYIKRDLEKIEGIADLKVEKSILEDNYKKIIKKLFINLMILELIQKAKKEFDKTQPDLVNAQKYLGLLTEGKYTKIYLDTEEISNENGSVIKKWINLSRGTKEQLYLALRLGYASNYSKDKTTLEPNGKPDLPLIIDDAFVNFDLNRTKNAFLCLVEVAKTNQVLFFTCHTEQIKSGLDNFEYNLVNM